MGARKMNVKGCTKIIFAPESRPGGVPTGLAWDHRQNASRTASAAHWCVSGRLRKDGRQSDPLHPLPLCQAPCLIPIRHPYALTLRDRLFRSAPILTGRLTVLLTGQSIPTSRPSGEVLLSYDFYYSMTSYFFFIHKYIYSHNQEVLRTGGAGSTEKPGALGLLHRVIA